MQSACCVRFATVCCLAREKNRSEGRPLQLSKDDAGWKPALHMALENCTLCRGTGWKLVPRPHGAAGCVAGACDCGMEQRPSLWRERARMPDGYQHFHFYI